MSRSSLHHSQIIYYYPPESQDYRSVVHYTQSCRKRLSSPRDEMFSSFKKQLSIQKYKCQNSLNRDQEVDLTPFFPHSFSSFFCLFFPFPFCHQQKFTKSLVHCLRIVLFAMKQNTCPLTCALLFIKFTFKIVLIIFRMNKVRHTFDLDLRNTFLLYYLCSFT